MSIQKIKVASLMASTTLGLFIFSSCNSSSTTTNACSGITGCTTTATGFQFPDGSGGTVVCVNGTCTDSSSQAAYNNGYSAGYSSGQSATESSSAEYQAGYSAGASDQSASDSGDYAAGYNAGYSDGQSAQSLADSGLYNQGYNDGYSSGYNDGYLDGQSSVFSASVGSASKDTDLQKATLEKNALTSRAQFIANQFEMSIGAATQLTQLSDRVKSMAVAGQMTDNDRAAVTQAALGIAGVSPSQVSSAIAKMDQGDSTAASSLMEKAAQNLGMPSSAALRDKLLPALGLSLN